MISFISAGLYSSLQDAGRTGYRHMGVPICGAMDLFSFQLANSLLDNPVNMPVLEFTSPGPKLQFLESAEVVVTGANFRLDLDGEPIITNKKIIVPKGGMLNLGNASTGFWGYLSVKGGFMAERILNSASYCSGVTSTSVFKKGDVLTFNKSQEPEARPNNALLKMNGATKEFKKIIVFKGPEFGSLSKRMQEELFNGEITVSSISNRMAYVLDHSYSFKAKEILTAAVQPGTVQLTPSGKLIVLMRDAQTTGGYARILQLTENSMNILAQRRPGESVCFQLMS